MSDPEYTRCPGCRTIFRVTAQQLALRGGQVRCGHCKNVFDGMAERVTLAPRAPAAAFHDERLYGPPTVTLRPEHALEPVGSPPPGYERTDPAGLPPRVEASSEDRQAIGEAGGEAGGEATQATGAAPGQDDDETAVESAAPAADAETEAPPVPYEERFSQLQRSHYPTALERAYPVALPLLLLLLIGQAAFHFRDALAAHLPAAKPVLTRVCEALGCGINPLRDSAGLAIDASDLQADPAHKGLLLLTATLRNRAGWSVAYPYLELTLTDAQDQVVVRRALAPADYARGTADIAAGIAANGEVPVRLFIDASATTQAGYRLYAFYP
jgi:predicted Zn finger-like uncharacterized protein